MTTAGATTAGATTAGATTAGRTTAGRTAADITIAVIIVVKNGARTLRRAIESVLGQSHPRVQLIIIDGASTDGTLEIIASYAARIHYSVSRADDGLYFAMNEALSVCTANWCVFLGCDDMLLDSLHLVAAHMSDPDAVYYGRVARRTDGRLIAGRFSALRHVVNGMPHQAIFYPRSCYRERYDTRYPILADSALNIRLWGRGVPFRYLPFVIANFNDTGLSSRGDAAFEADKARLLGDAFGPLHGLFWRVWFRLHLWRRHGLRAALSGRRPASR